MVRNIIHIDEEKCNGCGACVSACLEGAMAIVDGKARLLRDDYCDGLGACLPVCPMDALTITQREAQAFNTDAVAEHMAKLLATGAQQEAPPHAPHEPHAPHAPHEPHAPHPHHAPHQPHDHQPPHGGCPGVRARQMHGHDAPPPFHGRWEAPSRLGQWPVQIQLAPVHAPCFDNAKLLVAADCTAYAFAAFHERFMRGHVTLIGCPKLDAVDYTEKLTAILQENDIRELTVVRMEVPCCGGIERAAKAALQASGKFIPWQVVTISTDGHIIE